MKALNVDETGDLVLVDNQLTEVAEKEEIRQRFRDTLKTNKNEWFLDPLEGLDYSVVQGKDVDTEYVQDALDDVAEQVEEVDRIKNLTLESDRSKRTLSIFFIVVLTNGDELEMREVF
ncbi:hypothetical protein G4V62_13760 [Bacillaceae bacterium SIJ1]|uniref:hypothetical protein n=1 Tax=Litoribacterium kuwaitense TaxID=1398745 RepID=UPI0013EDAE39|nr:hypothetical protein [Litoribacterium kuwaitense]NGP45960.1 hypothetical protein [Litoribacterium kuwaitense]